MHMAAVRSVLRGIASELKDHMPFTLLGTLTAIGILIVFEYLPRLHGASYYVFYTLHPFHVFLSAIATTAMFRLHARPSLIATVIVGYVGSVGIGTLSDSLIPYLGELLIGLEHAEPHIGFIEKWWLVNPLALAGVAVAFFYTRTKIPHAGHVLLSTWASLSHFLMAWQAGGEFGVEIIVVPIFLFVAVWVPCCTSDIVFPLILARKGCAVENCPHHRDEEG